MMVRKIIKIAFIVLGSLIGLVILSGTCLYIGIQFLGDPVSDAHRDVFVVGKEPRLVIRDRSHLTTSIAIHKGQIGTIEVIAHSYFTTLSDEEFGYKVFQEGDTIRVETKPTRLWPRINPLALDEVALAIDIIAPEGTILDIESDHAIVTMP